MPDSLQIIETLLRQQTPVAFQAHGPSMNPTIRDGDRIRVLPLSVATLKTGCIVLYRIHGRITVHRLLINKKRTNRIFTAADAALRSGDWIPIADILGVAQAVIHDGREVRLDTRRARWTGLLRFYARPLRRLATGFLRRRTPPL
jgi:signal peptidase I